MFLLWVEGTPQVVDQLVVLPEGVAKASLGYLLPCGRGLAVAHPRVSAALLFAQALTDLEASGHARADRLRHLAVEGRRVEPMLLVAPSSASSRILQVFDQ